MFYDVLQRQLREGRPDGDLVCKCCDVVQEKGPLGSFMWLPEATQRWFTDMALRELAAFLRWTSCRLESSASEDMLAAWDLLSDDEKFNQAPEDHRGLLESHKCWGPLLVAGPPPCGPIPIMPGEKIIPFFHTTNFD